MHPTPNSVKIHYNVTPKPQLFLNTTIKTYTNPMKLGDKTGFKKNWHLKNRNNYLLNPSNKTSTSSPAKDGRLIRKLENSNQHIFRSIS